jgi:hypothetical protein
MDIGILNSLGYFEVIEISIWLGVMYFGKCWVDNYFKDKSKKKCKCSNSKVSEKQLLKGNE